MRRRELHEIDARWLHTHEFSSTLHNRPKDAANAHSEERLSVAVAAEQRRLRGKVQPVVIRRRRVLRLGDVSRQQPARVPGRRAELRIVSAAETVYERRFLLTSDGREARKPAAAVESECDVGQHRRPGSGTAFAGGLRNVRSDRGTFPEPEPFVDPIEPATATTAFSEEERSSIRSAASILRLAQDVAAEPADCEPVGIARGPQSPPPPSCGTPKNIPAAAAL